MRLPWFDRAPSGPVPDGLGGWVMDWRDRGRLVKSTTVGDETWVGSDVRWF